MNDHIAYIGLGSNLHGPCSQIAKAIACIAALPNSQVLAVSGLYRTPPMGPQDQPCYVNSMVKVSTQMSPSELLQETQSIEQVMGRTRSLRWGPRVIDLDIILFGNLVLNIENLRIPHPGLKERNFVSIPLAELSPALILPCGTPIAEIAGSFANTNIDRI